MRFKLYIYGLKLIAHLLLTTGFMMYRPLINKYNLILRNINCCYSVELSDESLSALFEGMFEEQTV